jgi:RimJ/RimL family protein N-acetyltransferase
VDRWREHWDRHGFGVFALEERGNARLVGRCGPAFHRLWPEDPELGWMLDPDVWGRGYATEAGAACLRPLFEEHGFDRVVSIVLPENARSIAVQERLGFTRWREVLWPEAGVLLEVRSLTRAGWHSRSP